MMKTISKTPRAVMATSQPVRGSSADGLTAVQARRGMERMMAHRMGMSRAEARAAVQHIAGINDARAAREKAAGGADDGLDTEAIASLIKALGADEGSAPAARSDYGRRVFYGW